jgi:HSP20 family protein
MTQLAFRPFVPAFRTWSNFDKILNDVFNTPVYNDGASHFSTPSVNIAESEAAFNIAVAAPGLTKEDFKVNVEDDTLTISAEQKATTEAKEGEKIVRREFSYAKFRRSFNLPETIDVTNITAAYEAGVLNLTLPKVEVKKTAQSIEIQ